MFSGGIKFSEDDFSLDVENTRSNLSTIFGFPSENSSQEKDNRSMKYDSQKSSKNVHSKKPEWSIQIAKVVSAFKLIGKENVSQGKLGFTVLENDEENRKIILYKSKTNILSTTTLSDDVKFYIKKPYLQFRDDLQVFWSVLFEQESDFGAVFDLIKNKIVENQETEATHKVTENSENTIQNKIAKDEILYATEDDTRTDLVQRMAKVGQPLPQMVPTQVSSAVTDFSDSSDNESNKTLSAKPLVPVRKPTKSSQQLVTYAHSQQTIAPMMNTISAVASYSSSLLPDSQLVNMLMAETRTQNTEVRMNISKLETKIERVLDKIDSIQSQRTDSNTRNKEDEILDLEEKLLEYKKENRKLKLKIEELKNEYHQENLNSVHKEDFAEFQTLLESLHIDVDKHNTSDEVLKELIKKLAKRNTEQSGYENEVKILRSENEQLTKLVEENKTLICKTNELESLISSLKKENSILSQENETVSKKCDVLTLNIETLTKDKENLTKTIVLQENETESKELISNTVKDIFSNLFQKLVDKFSEKSIYPSEEILTICASTIKQETYNSIKKLDKN